MEVMRSIRFGSTPSWTTLPVIEKSSTDSFSLSMPRSLSVFAIAESLARKRPTLRRLNTQLYSSSTTGQTRANPFAKASVLNRPPSWKKISARCSGVMRARFSRSAASASSKLPKMRTTFSIAPSLCWTVDMRSCRIKELPRRIGRIKARFLRQ
jgi:hypothetical protein